MNNLKKNNCYQNKISYDSYLDVRLRMKMYIAFKLRSCSIAQKMGLLNV